MIINHNISALNTYRQLSANNTNTQKSLEKLSSGLRINRAGDDAAGLAISEKMRAQIRGLEQAQRNSQDAISLIQTAEGGLNETHAILQRMRELATQAANDTNVNVDREEIQKEINQLTSEINRIGNTTEFNTQKLLNGGIQPAELTASTTGTGKVTLTGAVKEVAGEWTIKITALADGEDIEIGGVGISAADNGSKDLDTGTYKTASEQAAKIVELLNNDSTFAEKYTATDNADGSITIRERTGKATGNHVDIGGSTVAKLERTVVTSSTKKADPVLKITTAFKAGDSLTIGNRVITFGNDSDNFDIDVTVANDIEKQADALARLLAKESGIKSAVSDGVDTITITQDGGAGFSATFQVGANMGQSMTIDINDMRAAALGIAGIAGTVAENVTDAVFVNENNVTNGTDNNAIEAALDVSDHKKATAAIKVINDAIEKVSAERSKLGAFQNRLEHTINNLGTSAENLTAAESRIRDVDMAKEMMEFTKQSILSQAAQAMLAQANQQPQGVLQLLR